MVRSCRSWHALVSRIGHEIPRYQYSTRWCSNTVVGRAARTRSGPTPSIQSRRGRNKISSARDALTRDTNSVAECETVETSRVVGGGGLLDDRVRLAVAGLASHSRRQHNNNNNSCEENHSTTTTSLSCSDGGISHWCRHGNSYALFGKGIPCFVQTEEPTTG